MLMGSSQLKLGPVLFSLLHLGAALVCVFLARQKRQGMPRSSESGLWWWYAVVLLLLGLDALLRLEDSLSSAMRLLAQDEAWYAQRGAVQMWALVVLAAVGLGVLGIGRIRIANVMAGVAHRLVRAGLAVLFVNLALRAVSWHDTDQILYLRLVFVSLGRWLDVLGLGLVSWGVWHRLRLRAASSGRRQR